MTEQSVSRNEDLVMPGWSAYAGQPVDVSRRRSICIRELPGESSLEDISCLTIDYFLHEGQFCTAVIPLDGVTDVHGQAFNFSAPRTRKTAAGKEVVRNRSGLPKRKIPILNHVQSRFRFLSETKIQLYPLLAEDLSEPTAEVDDFVYSLEVTGPPGVRFNVPDGLRGNLLSAHRMLSTQEMVFERLVVENQILTESPVLPLKPAERRALLVRSLLRSHHAGMSEPYYLYRFCGTNNCTSSPFQILDQVVSYSPAGRVGSLLYRLPLNPRFYLRVRGLYPDYSQRRMVREEFADYIDHPDTRARKRDYVRRINALKKARRRQAEPDSGSDSAG